MRSSRCARRRLRRSPSSTSWVWCTATSRRTPSCSPRTVGPCSPTSGSRASPRPLRRPRTDAGVLGAGVVAGYPAQPGSDVYGLAAVTLRALTGYVPTQALLLPGIPPATRGRSRRRCIRTRPAAPTRRRWPMPCSSSPTPCRSASPTTSTCPTQVTTESPPHRSRHAARETQPEAEAPPAAGRTPRRHIRPRPPPSRLPRLAGSATGTLDSPEALEVPPRRRRPTAEPEPQPRRRLQGRHRADADAGHRDPGDRGRRRLRGAATDQRRRPGVAAWGQPAELARRGRGPVDLCGGPQPAPTEEPPQVSDWTQVVRSLYALRRGIRRGRRLGTCDVYTPTSQVLAEDAELLQLYADAGVHTEGLAFEVVTAEMLSQEGGRVVLEITDRLPPYQLVDDSGEVVAEKEGAAGGDVAGRARSCLRRFRLAVRLTGLTRSAQRRRRPDDGGCVRVLELESRIARPSGHQAQADQDVVGEFAVADPEGELRDRQQRRPAELPGEDPRELRVGHRLGRRHVVRDPYSRVSRSGTAGRGPRRAETRCSSTAAPRERPSEPLAEPRQHAGECTAVPGHDHVRTRMAHGDAGHLGRSAAASHSWHMSARKPSPGGSSSSRISEPCASP